MLILRNIDPRLLAALLVAAARARSKTMSVRDGHAALREAPEPRHRSRHPGRTGTAERARHVRIVR